jgi:hypothetical protein
MKIIIALCFTFVAFAAAYAQESKDLEAIIRKRDAVLTQIVEAIQSGLKAGSGTATLEQLRDATINLYSFRRDSTKTRSERLQWQERIVATEKEWKASTKKHMEVGTAGPMDELLAEERVLAAEQQLLEIQVVK